jgi:1-deoxyxylulose-5-phosphate synthase
MVDRVAYDEFGLFHENAEEHGLPVDEPPAGRREAVEVEPGRHLSALVWGDGPPELVLVHAGAQNVHTWDTIALVLGPRSLVVLDLPGHGHSDGPGERQRRERSPMAAALRVLAPAAGGVVGMSFGGLTAVCLADVAPELTRRLVLVDVRPAIAAGRARHIVDFVNGPTSFSRFDDVLARTVEVPRIGRCRRSSCSGDAARLGAARRGRGGAAAPAARRPRRALRRGGSQHPGRHARRAGRSHRPVRPDARRTWMKYVKLGSTGLEVSAVCLGCMSYGAPDQGTHPWSLDEEASRPFFRRALDGGINFFGTANVYSLGSSEEILGRAIRELTRRDEVVIATKVAGRMRPGPNGAGLSRRAILAEVDASLGRLGTDYIDLYQIHRWDPRTPIEETLEALDDVVRVGKVRYIGASSMWAWQFSKALHASTRHGWSRFVSMQDHYNLLNREEEREMLPLCADQGIAVLPWSPLARGRLTRDWDAETARSQTDEFGKTLYDTAASDRVIVERVAAIAGERHVPRAQVAMAWLLHKPVVTSPIVGATKLDHLDDAIAAVDLELSDEEIGRLEDPYVPHPVVGFS